VVGREQDRKRYISVVRCKKKAAGRGFRMTMEFSCNCDRDRGGVRERCESMGRWKDVGTR
jgi:hypothetical protein